MRIALFAALATFLAVGGYAADPCDANWSGLLGPYDHPETATVTEWSISKQIASKVMRDCPTGPTDKEGRRLFFEFAERQLSLDYARLTSIWDEQGHPLSEGGEESIWEFENQLRQYVSSIADPKHDAKHIQLIVSEGRAAGIAKFGRSVAPLVEHRIATPQEPRGALKRLVHSHHARLEAIRALGLWIASEQADFSVGEKRNFSGLLLRQLPKPEETHKHPTIVTVTILEALAHSCDDDVAKSLVEWTNECMKYHRSQPTDSIPKAALLAANAIAANSEKK